MRLGGLACGRRGAYVAGYGGASRGHYRRSGEADSFRGPADPIRSDSVAAPRDRLHRHTLYSAPPRPHSDRSPAASAEAYFRSLVENARDVIHVINEDRTTRYITPSIKRLLGWTPEEMIGRPATDLVHPEDVEHALAALRRDRTNPGAGQGLQLRVRHRDGGWRIFEAVGRNLLDDPHVRAIVVNSRDVTERRRVAEEASRLAAIPQGHPNPILEVDGEGRLAYANPAAEGLALELGLPSAVRLLPPNHCALVDDCLRTGEGLRVEVRVGGRMVSWVYHPQPGVRAVHLFAEDVTERKRTEARLVHQALHDALTGLPNRKCFTDRLAELLARRRRGESPQFGVLFLDLDRFKVVNDSLGHHVGDELLIAVADRLRGCLREGDLVARLGGDEFAVLLEDVEGEEGAAAAAERIAAAVATPIQLGRHEVFTSASIGVVLDRVREHERPEHLLREADVAMYRAKANPATRYELFDREMHAAAVARLELETELRRAVARREFILHYQPIICMSSGRMIGVEALVRWQHPTRGLLHPADFIATVEETGVIHAMGSWVLEEACRQLAEWRLDFPHARIAMSVNLSARQFAHRDLVQQVRAALGEHGLEPRHLKLEITESAIMEGGGAADEAMHALRALGIELQMDDFGTGYSSLNSLHRLPLDALKIDKSFIGRMADDEATRQLVRSIMLLARGMGLSTVAEGVETPQQLEEVRALGCDYAQGYYIALPLDGEDLRVLLSSNPVW
jgi:diguanylate cyclase (GGDEF)-like protein/PAS domain S-box-containing protein